VGGRAATRLGHEGDRGVGAVRDRAHGNRDVADWGRQGGQSFLHGWRSQWLGWVSQGEQGGGGEQLPA
jgi:hypothetical protein